MLERKKEQELKKTFNDNREPEVKKNVIYLYKLNAQNMNLIVKGFKLIEKKINLIEKSIKLMAKSVD